MKLDPNEREVITEQCKGCRRIESITRDDKEEQVCKLYLYPDKKWLYGDCAGLDNKDIISNDKNISGKRRVGQQKQRKF